MARLTLEQIWLSSTRLEGGAWRRNYSQSPKRQINQIVPFLGTRTVLFTGSFWGLTEKAIHLSNILVMDCEIIEEQPTKIQTPVQPNRIDNQIINQPSNQLPTQTYGGVVNAEPSYSSATHFKCTYNGKNYWVKKIDLRKQPVMVRCSCSDYFFVWSYSNYTNGIQFGGRSRPYVRKTPKGTGRPETNPKHVPGLCKHLAQMAQVLQTSGFAI